MKLEATLPCDDLSALIHQLLPLKAALGEDSRAYLAVDKPKSVELVPATGLRVESSAKLSWPVLGISVPVVLNGISMMLRPKVVRRADGLVLVFQVEIEHIDLAMLPALLDMTIKDRINRELHEREVELVWDFTSTLSHAFKLPATLTSVETFVLQVIDGAVDIDAQDLRLVVRFKADVLRKAPEPAPVPVPALTPAPA